MIIDHFLALNLEFDPVKGFFKLEEMELELNNHVKKDKDFFLSAQFGVQF